MPDGQPVIRTCWLKTLVQPYLRTSSDPTRVHVKRVAVDPFTGQELEGTFNLENMRALAQRSPSPTGVTFSAPGVGLPGEVQCPAGLLGLDRLVPAQPAPSVAPPAEPVDDLWLRDGDVIEVPRKVTRSKAGRFTLALSR